MRFKIRRPRGLKDTEMSEHDQRLRDEQTAQHAEVQHAWYRTAESLRRLRLLEIEVALLGRGGSSNGSR